MSLWLKLLLEVFLAALAIAIGVVFIWYGVTRDPVVIGLICNNCSMVCDILFHNEA
jgi:hypothetical protein